MICNVFLKLICFIILSLTTPIPTHYLFLPEFIVIQLFPLYPSTSHHPHCLSIPQSLIFCGFISISLFSFLPSLFPPSLHHKQPPRSTIPFRLPGIGLFYRLMLMFLASDALVGLVLAACWTGLATEPSLVFRCIFLLFLDGDVGRYFGGTGERRKKRTRMRRWWW